jgi:probable rRNA maturation factor
MILLNRKVVGVSEPALSRFLLRARRAAGVRGTVNLLVTSSAAMRLLNRQFRRLDKPTDVLSFPAEAAAGGKSHRSSKRPALVGEIAISGEIAVENARRLGHPAAVEIKILALHGLLHLAGFDHERDNGEMARKEVQLRQVLKLPATLIERAEMDEDGPGATSRKRISMNSRSTSRSASSAKRTRKSA